MIDDRLIHDACSRPMNDSKQRSVEILRNSRRT